MIFVANLTWIYFLCLFVEYGQEKSDLRKEQMQIGLYFAGIQFSNKWIINKKKKC